MAYENIKDLTRRTASDKILCEEAFNIAKNLKYGKYERKKKTPYGGDIKSESISNQRPLDLAGIAKIQLNQLKNYANELSENSRK